MNMIYLDMYSIIDEKEKERVSSKDNSYIKILFIKREVDAPMNCGFRSVCII